jgi:hypothetical protein
LVQRAREADFIFRSLGEFGGLVSEMEIECISWRDRECCENFWENQFRRGFDGC